MQGFKLCGVLCCWRVDVSAAGPWPSPRRSHAAVIMGGSLWVQGGLDSSGQHLPDLWRCDLGSWQWQQLGAKVGPAENKEQVGGNESEAAAGLSVCCQQSLSGCVTPAGVVITVMTVMTVITVMTAYRQLQTLRARACMHVCVPTTGVTCCLNTCVNVLQAGGLVGSCSPAGRRGHCLVGVQGRFLLLHGGHSGSCELLQDAWLYDTHRDVWLPVELTGRGRAQHKSHSCATVGLLSP